MKKMVFRLSLCLLFGACFSPTSFADEIWTASLAPGSAIQGTAGSTIGWGYNITNVSPDRWLDLSNLSATPFLDATAQSVFDFPILAPGQSVTVNFLPGSSGLLGLTWDASAPVGFLNSGSVILLADWFTGDPLSNGNLIGSAGQNSLDFTATVAPSGTSVPEPGTVPLFASGLLALVGAARKRIFH